jgi:hypothetical protein
MTGVLDHRIRGFRLIDVVALGCLIALVFGVYLAKTLAGRERQEIARIEREMRLERQKIRLLTAEVAHLETPERVERLSSAYLGLKPLAAEKQAPEESLQEIARLRGDTTDKTPPRYGKSNLLPQPEVKPAIEPATAGAAAQPEAAR